jgi:hypothetical protein
MRTLRRSLMFIQLVFVLILTVATARAITLTTLQPGQFREINQRLRVNVVFVGYHQGTGSQNINEAVFRAGLPHRYRTMDLDPSGYIHSSAEADQIWIGNSFDYDYNIVYANQAFEDAYFTYLPTISVPCQVTGYQDYYNTQHSRSLDITNNSCIEATLAERWLAQNAPTMLGVDTGKYTIFLINWFGRSDFRFHTYAPYGLSDPDPDTGFVLAGYQSREMIAWGGTTPNDQQNGLGFLSRIWFYDLSAGPEFNTTNFLLDADDPTWPFVAGGPYAYLIPPVWEYGNTSAYRPFTDLSGDLAKVTRYVGLDLLFTKSPILPPALSPPKMPQSIQLEINTFNGDPPANPRDYINADRMVAEESEIRPYNTFSVSIKDHEFSGRLADIYRCTQPSTFGVVGPTCYGNRPLGGNDSGFGDMFLYMRDHELQYLDGDADYEVPVMSFFVPENLALGFSGLAMDNHTDGKQASFCFIDSANTFERPFFGTTWTTIHEVGHHLGASHPHDGFDYEDFQFRFPYQPEYYFIWAGDASDTVMSYLQLSNNFSQFDRDNMNRWMTAIYINQANTILPKVLASPRANQIDEVLSSADADAASALTKYDNLNYLDAVVKAKSAYDKVLAAAAQIHIQIEPNGSPSEFRSHRPNPGLIDPPTGRRLLSPELERIGMQPFR